MRTNIILFLALSSLLMACGTPKKLKVANAKYAELDNKYSALQSMYTNCMDSSARYQDRIKMLNESMNQEKGYSEQLMDQLKGLSVISSSQAESIKRSLENINGKDAYIKDLQSAIARKDSLTMNLVMNLKGAVGNLDDQDINIKIEKGVVYIDISDKLLFNTGKYDVTDKAKEVLGKVAKVLLNQPDIEFMVEGHTDSVPYRQGVLQDNWDLSVKRATSVTRILQNEYNIPPTRMTAAGRGEYLPVASNDTEQGRAKNRRTRIIILPQLDQFFKLLEKHNVDQ